MSDRLPVHTGTARAFARHLDNLDEDLKPIDRTMIAALLEDAADEIDKLRAETTSNSPTTRFVAVIGCDDYTPIKVKATPAQWALIDRLASVITTNGGGCAPTMDADYDLAPDEGTPDLDLTVERGESDGGDS